MTSLFLTSIVRCDTGIYRWWPQAPWPAISARSRRRLTRYWLASAPAWTHSQSSSSQLSSGLGQSVANFLSDTIAKLDSALIRCCRSYFSHYRSRVKYENLVSYKKFNNIMTLAKVWNSSSSAVRILVGILVKRQLNVFLSLFLPFCQRDIDYNVFNINVLHCWT